MYGEPWPTVGEFDIYEAYNLQDTNMMTLHTGSAATYGACSINGTGSTAKISTHNCDNTFSNPPTQYSNQGCSTTETVNTFSHPNGAVCELDPPCDTLKGLERGLGEPSVSPRWPVLRACSIGRLVTLPGGKGRSPEPLPGTLTGTSIPAYL